MLVPLFLSSAYAEPDSYSTVSNRLPAVYFEGRIQTISLGDNRPSTPGNATQSSRGGNEPYWVSDPHDRWKHTILRVCFLEDRSISTQVAKIASKWNNIANFTLDFGDLDYPRLCDPNTPSEIRITYDSWPPRGHWSLIGTKSMDRKDQTTPTLKLESYDGSVRDPPKEPEFTWLILHEFGHAIGFQHEYRNPLGGCDKEFRWDDIYARWGNKEEADAQLRQVKDSSAYGFSNYDKQSVMRYYYPAEYFEKGMDSPCYGEPVSDLSPVDKEGLRAAYPFDPQSPDR